MNVGIIGAGPSGAYCGLRILTLARERGLDCTVHLFDPKSFHRTGPQGCNFCAGLISVQVVDRFKADGIDLEKGGYLQRTIRGFKLVTAGGSEKFYAPRGNNLFSVFRGGGPAKSDSGTNPSFDRLLLSRTVEAGAIHHPHQVTAISKRTGPSGFSWDLGTSDGQTSNVDMLVGAFGVNSGAGALFEGLGFGYQRPECESTLQAEFELDEKFIHQTYRNLVILFTDSGTDSADVVIGAFGLDDSMQRVFEKEVGYIPPKSLNTIVTKVHPADQRMIDDFQGRIESFLVPVPGSSFGAIVPKKDHLSIVLAGRRVTTRHMLQFLELPQVKKILSFDHELDFAFRGAFPNGPAKRFYGNRYAMVGDATGLVRPFKGKGINSAAITGIRVAETIINEGISEDAFSNYARRCEGLAGGVKTGQLVQFIAHLLGRTVGFGSMVDFASTSEDFREALYGAVSGTMSYGKVMKISLKPAILIGLAGAYLRSLRAS